MSWKDVVGKVTSVAAPVLGAVTGGVGGVALGMAGSYLGNRVNSSASASTIRRQAGFMSGLSLAQQKQLAENMPSWQVEGMRKAGLNPLLTVDKLGGSGTVSIPTSGGMGGGSAAPSTVDSAITGASAASAIAASIVKERESAKQSKIQTKQMKDALDTQRAENKLIRTKANVENKLLEPVWTVPLEGDAKSVGVGLPSETFRHLEKGIRDRYQLNAEKYIRETIREGGDALRSLPSLPSKKVINIHKK